jgi:hypothetical protein
MERCPETLSPVTGVRPSVALTIKKEIGERRVLLNSRRTQE